MLMAHIGGNRQKGEVKSSFSDGPRRRMPRRIKYLVSLPECVPGGFQILKGKNSTLAALRKEKRAKG